MMWDEASPESKRQQIREGREIDRNHVYNFMTTPHQLQNQSESLESSKQMLRVIATATLLLGVALISR